MRAIQAARRYTWRSGLVTALALMALVLAACSGARTNDNPTSDAAGPGLFPGEVVTQQGNQSAGLYLPIFLVAVVVFILVEGLVLYVTLRFRRKASDTQLPPQTHGNNLLEVVWTTIPFIVVMVLFVGSFMVLQDVEAKEPNPAVTVDATAFQWQWKFEYPELDIKPLQGAGKQGPEMVVPINERVRIRLHATDVIHAFYVPSFFYKKDAIPGRTNEFEIIVEKAGTYGGQCAEFCGLSHADMYFTVRAVERADYDAWVQQKIAEAAATPTPKPPPASGEPKPTGPVVKVLTTAEAPLAFDVDTITAKAGTSLTIEYTNDSGVPHNIAFYEGEDATAPVIAVTVPYDEAQPGPGDVQTLTFDVPAEPGSYYFDCQIHPAQMFGTFEVTA